MAEIVHEDVQDEVNTDDGEREQPTEPPKKLPSGAPVEYVGMLGRSERKLWEQMQAKNPDAYDYLLAATVKKIDDKEIQSIDDLRHLLSVDKIALLLFVAWETHGPEVPFQDECKECRKKYERKARLDVIDFSVRPNLDTGPFELPKTRKQLTYELSTGITEQKYAKVRRGARGLDPVLIMLARGVKLDNKIARESELENLPSMDFNEILKRLKSTGGPDTSVEWVCQCGDMKTRRLELLPELFLRGVSNR